MAILLTGGGGKTSLRLAEQLKAAGVPFVLASRRGEAAAPAGLPAVKFDWMDSSTFSAPFEHKFPGGETITAVYLVAPGSFTPNEQMGPFIDLAMKKYGVKRFVLLAGATAEPDGFFVGKVWQHLIEAKVEYCVLKPTWFMENFSESFHTGTIKHESKIYTATGDGKIAFIGATDIAAVAVTALTSPKAPNSSYMLVGPEALSHDEIAAKLSSLIGRKIENVKLTYDERVAQLTSHVGPEYAKMLTGLEQSAAGGSESLNDVVSRVGGKKPQTFDEYAKASQAAWK